MKLSVSSFVLALPATLACPFLDQIKEKASLNPKLVEALAKQSQRKLGRDGVESIHTNDEVVRNLQDGLPPLDPPGAVDEGGQAQNPTLANNGFYSPGLRRFVYSDPITGDRWRLPEVIAEYSAGNLPGLEDAPGVGEDLCYFAMQSIPPPATLEMGVQAITRTVDGVEQDTYLFPNDDLEDFHLYCDRSSRDIQSPIGQAAGNIRNLVQFGTCAAGSEAAKAFCAADIEGSEGSYCADAKINNSVAWTQAIYIFRITPDNIGFVDSFIDGFRSSFHRDASFFSTLSPGGTTTRFGVTYNGANNAGWGNNGGLRAKIVACSAIDENLIKPAGPNGDFRFGADALFNDTITYGELAAIEWEGLCGIPLFAEEESSCMVDASTPMDPTLPSPNATSFILPFDETCSGSPEFVADSVQCGRDLSAVYGDLDNSEMLEESLRTGLAACRSTFCNELYETPGAVFEVNDLGLLTCSGGALPTTCEEVEAHLTSTLSYMECVVEAQGVTFEEARMLSETSIDTVASAGGSLAACEDALTCTAAVKGSMSGTWPIRFCANFMETLLDPEIFADDFTFLNDCGYTLDTAYAACDIFIYGASSVPSAMPSDVPSMAPTKGPTASPTTMAPVAPTNAPAPTSASSAISFLFSSVAVVFGLLSFLY